VGSTCLRHGASPESPDYLDRHSSFAGSSASRAATPPPAAAANYSIAPRDVGFGLKITGCGR
jgi:hypothetical protein